MKVLVTALAGQQDAKTIKRKQDYKKAESATGEQIPQLSTTSSFIENCTVTRSSKVTAKYR